MAKIVNQMTVCAVEDAGKGECSFTAGGVQMCAARQCGSQSTGDPAVPLSE